MNTKLVFGTGSLALIIVIVGGIYLYSPHQQGGIVEKGGLYYVGTKTLGAGYISENGRILYVERTQFYTGTSSPEGVRYDAFAVAGANAATFSVMADAASENSEEVYYQWGKDDKNVFYQGLVAQPLASSTPPIDTRSFTVIPSSYPPFGKDRNAVYEFSPGTYKVLVGVDPATFAFIGGTCAKDKDSFYTIGYYGEFAATTSTALTPAQCVRPGP